MLIIELDKTATIYRLESLGGNKIAYTTLTLVDVTIQPLGDEKTAIWGGAHGKMFKIYTDVDKDIRQGDNLRDADGNIYEVVSGGVENRNDGFIADYLDLTCKRIDTD